MNKKLVIRLVSVIVGIEGLAMLLSAVVSWLMRDPFSVPVRLAACGVFSLLAACGVFFAAKPKSSADHQSGLREGFAAVALSWVAASVFGMIPYITVAGLYWYDAFFETMSGFSTTGASVIDSSLILMGGETLQNGVESLPFGLLFWRCLTHWIGGMGIVVLTIAILPLMNMGGQVLYNAEVTGVKSMDSQIAPRIASCAKILWLVYVVLTLSQAILLKFGGMTWFDAVCHSFSTISTGGFSTRQLSLAYYQSAYIDWVVIVFMFLAGCNFVLHFRLVSGKPLHYLKDEEFRFYTGLVLLSTLLIAIVLTFTDAVTDPMNGINYLHKPFEAVRASAFQVVSLMTTTGFSTGDYTTWPALACVILFGLVFIGACGGSTAGGMKCVRAMLVGRHSRSEIQRCIFPHMVPNIRLNGTRLETATVQKTIGFFSLFICLYFAFVLILPAVCPGMDYSTSVSASVACLSNIGPGFGQIGPMNSYSWMTPSAKILLSFEMLLGRLELYTVLVLFLPSFWKK